MQKDIFKNGEGDAWFERNHQTCMHHRHFDRSDPVIDAVETVNSAGMAGFGQLLEIGCGEGKRLAWIAANHGWQCHGVDPSQKAIEEARLSGLQAVQGTADQLPYETGTFDLIIFGFCLYLCDREDLFRIAAEADRVLKPQGCIIIQDFYATSHTRRNYHHHDGIYSYKMDYGRLFDWHPAYSRMIHTVTHHGTGTMTDDAHEWVATTTLRKNSARQEA